MGSLLLSTHQQSPGGSLLLNTHQNGPPPGSKTVKTEKNGPARWWSVFLCFHSYPHQFWRAVFLCFFIHTHVSFGAWSVFLVSFPLFHISFGARWSVFLCFHSYAHQFLEPGPFSWCFHPFPHQFWSPAVVRFSLFSPIPTSVLEPGGGPLFSVFTHTHIGGGPFFSVFTHTHISFGARWWSVFLCFHPYPHQFWSPVAVRFSLFHPYPHQFWSPVVVRFSLFSPIPTSVLEPGGGPFFSVFTHAHMGFGARWWSVFLCFHPYPQQSWSRGSPFFSVFTHTHISFGGRWWAVFLCFRFPVFPSIPTSVLEPGGGPFFSVFTHCTPGLPTKKDLSEFDEVDPDARTSTGDPGVSVEGYVITPDGEYFDPDSQETFQTLEAWKAQRRSSRHRVVRASATESTDPVHGGLEEPEERNPNYYGDDTEPKRGSIPLDEAFTRPDKFVLHHIAERKISSRSWPATQTRRGTRTR